MTRQAFGDRGVSVIFFLVATEKLKVFISWSGPLAKDVAIIWHELLREITDEIQPFVSDVDIEAGARGLDEIKAELDGTKFGIVIVTQSNQNAPWLNFEAGALSKALDNATVRVAPSLVDFSSPNQITSPLKQFQGSLLNKDGVGRILKTLAGALGAEWSAYEKRLDRCWDEYEQRFEAEKSSHAVSAKSAKRPVEDMVEEILTIARDLRRPSKQEPTLVDELARQSQKTISILRQHASASNLVITDARIFRHANGVSVIATVADTLNLDTQQVEKIAEAIGREGIRDLEIISENTRIKIEAPRTSHTQA